VVGVIVGASIGGVASLGVVALAVRRWNGVSGDEAKVFGSDHETELTQVARVPDLGRQGPIGTRI